MATKASQPMSAEQESVIKEILVARNQSKRLDTAHQQATVQLNAKVARALRQGIPAVVLAERLGLKVQRIYQMRDNTR